ncbi:MAG: hypothetical protein JO112_19850 [Planctomycetes bacterium]|nr:hypothetical protein [Planctomycetota bacterium]
MSLAEFCSRLQDELYPTIYRGGAISGAAPFALLLKHMKWLGLGRYALGVLPWEAVENKSRLLKTARKGIAKHLFTIPYFWQVGLYLVVTGPRKEWAPVARQINADQTGLHAVIIQAVHFIDLELDASVVKRSQWGPVQFGGTLSVTNVIEDVLDDFEEDRPGE